MKNKVFLVSTLLAIAPLMGIAPKQGICKKEKTLITSRIELIKAIDKNIRTITAQQEQLEINLEPFSPTTHEKLLILKETIRNIRITRKETDFFAQNLLYLFTKTKRVIALQRELSLKGMAF